LERQNKKESVAALHKENIMNAAEQIFSEKGFTATTIDDISKAAQYSRRTLYAYFESKEDILYHVILKGLITLKTNIEKSLANDHDFLTQYRMICQAMKEYQLNSPHSFDSVTNMKNTDIDMNSLPPIIMQIFSIGTEINNMLASFIENGKAQGIVRAEIKSMQTVYILWSNISSLLSLVQSKGPFISKEFATTDDEFLEYGFTQIINSILKERI